MALDLARTGYRRRRKQGSNAPLRLVKLHAPPGGGVARLCRQGRREQAGPGLQAVSRPGHKHHLVGRAKSRVYRGGKYSFTRSMKSGMERHLWREATGGAARLELVGARIRLQRLRRDRIHPTPVGFQLPGQYDTPNATANGPTLSGRSAPRDLGPVHRDPGGAKKDGAGDRKRCHPGSKNGIGSRTGGPTLER